MNRSLSTRATAPGSTRRGPRAERRPRWDRRPGPAQRRRRSRRPLLLGLVGVLGIVVFAGLALAGLRFARSGALPGTEVDGLEVGGLGGAELTAAMADYAAEREEATITVSYETEHASAAASDVGYAFDTEATVEAVLARGRQTNPLAALADHLRAFGGTIAVEPVHGFDHAVLATWSGNTARSLEQPPVEGSVEFVGGEAIRVDPEPGAIIGARSLREEVRAALLTNDAARDIEVTAEAEPLEPSTTRADVDGLMEVAERAVSGPVTLSRGEAALVFTPAEIGEVLTVDQHRAGLTLGVDADAFGATVSDDDVAAVERDPMDADITLVGGEPTITPSEDGFRFDRDEAARQLLEVATREGPREEELAGEVTPPGRTTEDVEALGITEQISSFTTEFTAGQSRVTNIQRIADLVDGVLLEPGETLSVNGHVGRRTRDRGFVAGGAIQDGEFVDEVGGGVSQFATTMYNAAYFGGYAIPEHREHSYYISRYPAGREATLNYPDIDLKVENNSPYGALISTSHTATSLTVSFWSTEWVDVDSIAGERRNITSPPTEIRETDDLPAGEERVVQSGREGFDITVTRVLTFPDGRVEREEEFTRYLPEPRIVERGTD